MAGTRISGWGSALPEKVVTNADLEATLDTSDQWIVERTGIRERRIGGTTSGLAIEAGQAALSRAGSDGRAIPEASTCLASARRCPFVAARSSLTFQRDQATGTTWRNRPLRLPSFALRSTRTICVIAPGSPLARRPSPAVATRAGAPVLPLPTLRRNVIE